MPAGGVNDRGRMVDARGGPAAAAAAAAAARSLRATARDCFLMTGLASLRRAQREHASRRMWLSCPHTHRTYTLSRSLRALRAASAAGGGAPAYATAPCGGWCAPGYTSAPPPECGSQ